MPEVEKAPPSSPTSTPLLFEKYNPGDVRSKLLIINGSVFIEINAPFGCRLIPMSPSTHA